MSVFCHPGRGGSVGGGQRRRRCPVRGRGGGAGRRGPEPDCARLLSGSPRMVPALGHWLLALASALGSAGVRTHFRLKEAGGGLRAPGDSVLLSCRAIGYNFENYPFRWYRQAPGGRLEWVSLSWSLGAAEYAAAVEGRATTSWDNSQSKSSLSLRALQPQDSARYFCAIHPETGNKLVFGSGTTLTVEPNIQEISVPQVILMKSKKLKVDSTGKAACLARNVYTKNISLDMSSNEVVYEPSASILTSEGLYDTVKVVSVTKGTELSCTANFNGSTITASTSLAEENAEDPEMGKVCNTTDTSAQAGTKVEKANMLSMAVLGLRVLLAKSIAFNTLMSIKLFLF
ncbi:Ig heavy chain Mem5-like [Neopsephotus bourkii]|uniref:Ig heavy chain Mem5-like n=1 Tax=Neopsephotus bourkii TaxID=309878 RepID=UPI002AA5DC22|nr:Ig heavy chain Mem5-like [Neopsephotus bourkii]